MLTSQTFPRLNAFAALVVAAVPPATVAVFFGPQPTNPTDNEFIVVGCNDASALNGRQIAIEGDSDNAAMGRVRQETFIIHNSYVLWMGDSAVSALCDQAAVTIGLIETALRTDVTINGDGWANGLRIMRIEIDPRPVGPMLHVQFDVLFTAYI